jgi:hypothetical protein
MKLLQKEIEEDLPHDDRTSDATKSPRDTSATVYSNRLENNKWTVITAKCRRKDLSPKNLTEANNTYPLSTANRYQQLTNIQDTLVEYITWKAQENNNLSDIPNCSHQTKLQHQSRERIQRIHQKHKEESQIYHIPTLRNGKIRNKNMEPVSSVVTRRNGVTKSKLRQNNVTMIGDSSSEESGKM